jgi:hypothetical protein
MSQRLRWISPAVLGALAAIAVMAIGPASAAKVTNVKSTVTIKSGEGSEFTGKVTSAQKKCRSGRKVKLLMTPYSGGEDELVGTARTDSSGAWEMKGSFMAGLYHAEAVSVYVHTGSGTIHCTLTVGMTARF